MRHIFKFYNLGNSFESCTPGNMKENQIYMRNKYLIIWMTKSTTLFPIPSKCLAPNRFSVIFVEMSGRVLKYSNLDLLCQPKTKTKKKKGRTTLFFQWRSIIATVWMCSSQIHRLKYGLQWDGIRRWVLWKVIRSWRVEPSLVRSVPL